MGQVSCHSLSPIITKTWTLLPPHSDIYMNILTSQYLRQHICQSPSLQKLHSFKIRMQQTNPNVTHVAFYFSTNSDTYHIYTDQTRNKISINSQDLKNIKQAIIETYKEFAKSYGWMNVCEEMIGMDMKGQVKCWIHPNVLSGEVWCPCDTEKQMMEDIEAIWKGIQIQIGWKRRRTQTVCMNQRQSGVKTFECNNKIIPCLTTSIQSETSSKKSSDAKSKNLISQPSKLNNLPYFLRQSEQVNFQSSKQGSSHDKNDDNSNHNTTFQTWAQECENEEEEGFILRRTKTCNVEDIINENLNKSFRKSSLAENQSSWALFKKNQKKNLNGSYENNSMKLKGQGSQNNLPKSARVKVKQNDKNKVKVFSETIKPSQKKHLMSLTGINKRTSLSAERSKQLSQRKIDHFPQQQSNIKNMLMRSTDHEQKTPFCVLKLKKVNSQSLKSNKKLKNIVHMPINEQGETQQRNDLERERDANEELNGKEFRQFFDEQQKVEYCKIQQKIGFYNRKYESLTKEIKKLLTVPISQF